MGGRFFMRRQGEVIVAMCRVDDDELCDVCTRPGWRGRRHATAVCRAALRWADGRLRAITECDWKRAWYARLGCLT